MKEWLLTLLFNVWGTNPDGQQDHSFVYGDIDGDGVLDRLNPASLLIKA
jgi:alpha-1,3-glucan synthase